MKDEVEDAMNLHRLIDDDSRDTHAFLHDERRIGNSSLGSCCISANQCSKFWKSVEREISDKISPTKQQHHAERIKEDAAHHPWEKSAISFRGSFHGFLHPAERKVDADEHEEDFRDMLLDEPERLGDDIRKFLHDITDRLGKILCDFPVCILLADRVLWSFPTTMTTALCDFQFEQPWHVKTGIDGNIIHTNLEMTVRAARKPRTACLCNLLALPDTLPSRNEQALIVAIKRCETATMVNDDSISISIEPSSCRNRPRLCRIDGGSIIDAEIDAAMVLFDTEDGMHAPALRTRDNHRFSDWRNHRAFARTVSLIHLSRIFF